LSETQRCPKCLGTGWIIEKTAAGPVAKRCACYHERQAEVLLKKANIPKRYRDCTLGNFEIHKDNASHKDALAISKKFVKNYPAQDVGLLLIGPCGVGKTHLAVGIIQELVRKKGASCVFYDFRDLIREIQNTFAPESALTESDVLAPVFRSEVLVLDELGAKRTTAWVEETVFYIINHRYNHKKTTIFTSNYPDTEEAEDNRDSFYKKGGDTLVDRIGVRLRSRVYEMCKIVEMEGEDYRKLAKQASYRF
jgi:DNA replication protein DnaC